MMNRPPRRPVLGLLALDLLGEVPGEDQHVVRLPLEQRPGLEDRQVRAGGETGRP